MERGGSQNADAHLEAVRWSFSAEGVVLHVPEMTELMFRAGGGTAGERCLHGKTAHHKAVD